MFNRQINAHPVNVITNALTIDVEDYFHVSAFTSHIKRSDWNSVECRIEKNIDTILEMLDLHQTKATFFTLGWVAERYPEMVRKIIQEGHELASHGYGHERVSDQTKLAFLSDVNLAKVVLENLSGSEVKGYRAPSFSIGSRSTWAFDCLAQAGYKYSSSVYPIHHDHYGMPDAPRFAYEACRGMMEIPVSTCRILNQNIPSAGGGYFRFFPYVFSKWLIHRVNKIESESCVFYFHPWEIDIDQPRIQGLSSKTRFRHYVNIQRMSERLNRLLGDFSWDRMDHVFSKRLKMNDKQN